MKHSTGYMVKVALTLLTCLIAISCGPDAADETPAGAAPSVPDYLPAAGDRALMAVHRFGVDDFESGKRTGIEAFRRAMEAFGQNRRTYFLDDPESRVVVEISFFHPDSDVDEWFGSEHLQEAMAIVTPFYREPVDVRRLFVARVHDTPLEASYLPRTGDRVIIFTLRFSAEGYEQGRRIVPEGFGQAMEASGQTRRTYFTDDPLTQTMLTFSFFHSSSATDEWLRHSERQAVLDVIEPLFREPLEVYHLTVEAVHDSVMR